MTLQLGYHHAAAVLGECLHADNPAEDGRLGGERTTGTPTNKKPLQEREEHVDSSPVIPFKIIKSTTPK